MDLDHWRECIDVVDKELVDLLNRRMEFAVEIGRIKKAEGLSVRDPAREEAVLEKLKEHNKGPFSDRGIEEIFSRIMQEARDLEDS